MDGAWELLDRQIDPIACYRPLTYCHPMIARLKLGETLGDRIIKVNHAGEHGAICIYRAQCWMARWRAPELQSELDDFLAHEIRHRSLFGTELERRMRSRCRSYHLCGLGGWLLGLFTGLAGRHAISATTVAIERVVLKHLAQQLDVLGSSDHAATTVIGAIIEEERQHHDQAKSRMIPASSWVRIIDPVVAGSTEAVIWMGMRL
jgi:ubiquinone biosynthesis monooxygenase Coq7